jgi:hypothetical protein
MCLMVQEKKKEKKEKKADKGEKEVRQSSSCTATEGAGAAVLLCILKCMSVLLT